jgi:hypothetical protein
MRRWLVWTLVGWCMVADLVIFFLWFHLPFDHWVVVLDAAMPPFFMTGCAIMLRLDNGEWPP